MEINETQEAFLQKQNELRKGIDLTNGFDPTTLKLTDWESHVPIPTRLADLETHVARETELKARSGEE